MGDVVLELMICWRTFGLILDTPTYLHGYCYSDTHNKYNPKIRIFRWTSDYCVWTIHEKQTHLRVMYLYIMSTKASIFLSFLPHPPKVPRKLEEETHQCLSVLVDEVLWWLGPAGQDDIINLLSSLQASQVKFCIWQRLCLSSFPRVETTFQYPLSTRVCNCLSKRLFRVVASIIELYCEYESRGRPCHCAAALRSLTRRAEIM